ncbi:amino acid adenylation domain protein [Candidatus Moduliflexus flocculans]|uniref:Amino acid adenylation domain protein n=1 Tax=Candidatus Moduliflexus flocculans TaxID=1499966 RepID=A0A081BM30_9BACT|nr:amino acid adenylation domain protein [Candidatus Moduliflexus flocculans]
MKEISEQYQKRLTLSNAKRALLEQRLQGKFNMGGTSSHSIPRHPRSDAPTPLSFAEQRLWFLEELEERYPTYTIPFGFRLKGQLNVAALEQSVNEIVRRHDTLRTSFTAIKGVPHKQILSTLTLPLPVHDLRQFPAAERDKRLQTLVQQEARYLFDLAQCPLLRVALLRLADQEHLFLLTIHHIVYDGWSIGVFMRELSALYNAFATGKSSRSAFLCAPQIAN